MCQPPARRHREPQGTRPPPALYIVWQEGRPLEDTELVERAQRRDTDAYAVLVERYQELAVRVAYLITGEVPEAEDAAQEAFVKAYYALDRLQPGAPFRPWLLRIVANEARNLRKAAQRRAHRLARAADGLSPRGMAPSVETAALASEQRGAIITALMRLREGDRLVIAYRYFLDLSEAEMAEALGLARGTVKSRLSRALGRLRERLRDVYPLLIAAPAFDRRVQEALVDMAAHLPHRSAEQFATAVLGRLAAGQPPRHGPSWIAIAASLAALGLAALAVVLLANPQSPAAAPRTGEKIVVYGDDLTEAERQELASLLEADETAEVRTVTREELAEALAAAGLPGAPNDEAISSLALTCLEPGQGVRVRTLRITRTPAAVYAATLLTARAVDASLIVAAPATRPVSGETAIVGLLKAASRCRGEQETDPARARLAYEQLRITAALAGDTDDLSKASAVMLEATRTVITGQAKDEASMGAALDAAAAAEGVTMNAAQRSEVLALLGELSLLDYGEYAGGYQIRRISPNEVELVPAGVGGP